MRKIRYNKSDPKITVSLAVNAENIASQLYDAASGIYHPERSLMPLVITPVVGYHNPVTDDVVENAADMLSDGHWYRIDGSNTAGASPSNEIDPSELLKVNGATVPDAAGNPLPRFDIVSTPGSPVYGRLTIYENTPPAASVTYVFRATLNVGKPRVVTAMFRSDTKAVTVMPDLRFDNVSEGAYNPWEDPAVFTIRPLIFPSGYAAKSFTWHSLHDGKWAPVDTGSSQYLDWALSAAADGTLSIRRDIMQDEIHLKCVAVVPVGGVDVTLERFVSHTRRLPEFIERLSEFGALNEGDTEFNPRLTLTTAKGVVQAGNQVEIRWLNNKGTVVATGHKPRIPLSSLPDGEWDYKVVDLGGYKALVDSSGAFLCDSDGKRFIIK